MGRVEVRESTMVRPSAQTPDGSLWLPNMDLVMPPIHFPFFYLFRHDDSANFFNASSVKQALSKSLVHFYPMAGRLKRGEDGRIAVVCNGEGALFVEARRDCVIDDLGDFAPTTQLSKLSPHLDYSSSDLSSYPLLLAQVTYFKCGGVSLMVLVHHTVADGTAAFHFNNTWSELARGLPKPTILPQIHRTPLQARNPPNPVFSHMEYRHPPTIKAPPQTGATVLAVSIFNISRDQIHFLQAQAQKESGFSYTTTEMLAAHVWRCACRAWDITDNQVTKLYIPVNGRHRLHPTLESGYFGNALFTATPIAIARNLMLQSPAYAAGIIHKALIQMDNNYLRSAVDYLEQLHDIETARVGPNTFESPNLRITSWNWMPIHDADFGWGRPIFTGVGSITWEGLCVMIPSPNGSFSLAISLQSHHMVRFQQFLYEF